MKTQDKKITLKNVRLSFPSLFRKAVFQGEETKYEATFLLDKVEHAALIAEIEQDIANHVSTTLKVKHLADDKKCLRDGDLAEYAGYAGCMSLKAASKARPLVIDRKKAPITEDDEIIYSGCYVNAIISLWVQNNDFGKRVNATLLAVQFVKDGEPLSGGASASVDDFDDLGDDDSDPFA